MLYGIKIPRRIQVSLRATDCNLYEYFLKPKLAKECYIWLQAELSKQQIQHQINKAECLKVDDINKQNSEPIYCTKSPWTCSVGTEITEQNEDKIP